ncbi:AbrB/MazE/SpoVT family DNA-binding domain-containing protein [Candidatus Methylacidithermus pantelleriae]|uniref:AbrB family transcriptional regulator n=1 Tax=Candidatus Methylacidithermus pantelleriae TaxID=2744239 RepID=A0A8J2BQI0_9BACT|nr:AbrB/MazE/SpoVT family DNA-binding domain-containing protein [Candidatus Methylacidithermus pantelleriae]CAF0698963.1 AbrB family transcriptional regulator [Candidatus Methylacidithermus pantelleriae]
MRVIGTTQLSSKGQIVIPDHIRKERGLKPGDQFVVMASGDFVFLKRLRPPSPEQLKALDNLAQSLTKEFQAGSSREEDEAESAQKASAH